LISNYIYPIISIRLKRIAPLFFSGMNFALLLKEIEHILSLFLKEKQKNA